MANTDLELLQGTLDLLILKTLTWGPRHGYAIASWIRDTTQQRLQIEDGALYTALHRMEKRAWIEAEWGLSDNNRRAKYYQLTSQGRRQLRAKTDVWTEYAARRFPGAANGLTPMIRRFQGLKRLLRIERGRATVERAVDDELRFHFDMTMRDLMAGGMTPDDARREAERRFGDVQRTRERLATIDRARVGQERRAEWWSAFAQDFRYALRGLRLKP